MSKSSIEWTQDTWNPVVGCSILSPGCTNCYAMKMAARIEAMNAEARPGHGNAPQYAGTTKKVNGHAVWTGKLAMAGDNILLQPLKRKKPTTYFVNSMGDLFHEDVPDEWIDKVFAVMALSPQHTFQVLTKRAKRMRDYCGKFGNVITVSDGAINTLMIVPGAIAKVWPLPNVWLGVSTERQQEADERIPLLLQTPAAVRFISAEPLLGPIDLKQATVVSPESGGEYSAHRIGNCLDWVIVGGESGPDARPMHPDWARSLRTQCEAAGVAFFFKQWGEFKNGSDFKPGAIVVMSDGRTCEFGEAKLVDMDREKPVPPTAPTLMLRVGKKRAGRALDGIEYNEMPEVAR